MLGSGVLSLRVKKGRVKNSVEGLALNILDMSKEVFTHRTRREGRMGAQRQGAR